MMNPSLAHKFNDDLLVSEEDVDYAAERYPTVVHVLDSPELRTLFKGHDGAANVAKRKGRIAGVTAITFGFLALALAALEIGLVHGTGSSHDASSTAVLRWAVAVASSLFGLAGFLIGSVGVLYAGRKRTWLHHRLMSERIRQFHFQSLVFGQLNILASLESAEAKSRYLFERSLWLEAFKAQHVGKLDSVFVATIDEERPASPWLYGDGEPAVDFAENDALQPIFKAYREFRIQHQIAYAEHKLQDDHGLFSSAPRRQLATLSTLRLTWVILLCTLHIGVILGAVLPSTIWNTFNSPEVIVLIIWVALAALGTVAIEQGLQPDREIERYRQYRLEIRAILTRYDQASTQREKRAIMQDMERLGFEEMRRFLQTNDLAKFVV